jgi:hypothetical protein
MTGFMASPTEKGGVEAEESPAQLKLKVLKRKSRRRRIPSIN